MQQEMWCLIGGDVVAHWWRCGDSLVEMWWLIGGDVVAPWWRCGGSLVELWWLIGGDVVARCTAGDVVAHW